MTDSLLRHMSQIDSTKASSAVQIEAVKNVASAWAEQFKSNL